MSDNPEATQPHDDVADALAPDWTDAQQLPPMHEMVIENDYVIILRAKPDGEIVEIHGLVPVGIDMSNDESIVNNEAACLTKAMIEVIDLSLTTSSSLVLAESLAASARRIRSVLAQMSVPGGPAAEA